MFWQFGWYLRAKIWRKSEKMFFFFYFCHHSRNRSKFLKTISQNSFDQKNWNFQDFHFSVIQTNGENFIKFWDGTQRKFSKSGQVSMEWPLFRQFMRSRTLRFILDQPLKQWLTGGKAGEDGNTKIWISWERRAF